MGSMDRVHCSGRVDLDVGGVGGIGPKRSGSTYPKGKLAH